MCLDRPIIGGALSNPVERFPNLFGNSKFLKEYPYFLPCAVPATYTVAAWLVACIFLKEVCDSQLYCNPAILMIESTNRLIHPRSPFGNSCMGRESELCWRNILFSPLKPLHRMSSRNLYRCATFSREKYSSPPRTTHSLRWSICLSAPCSPYSCPHLSQSAASDSILQLSGL